MSDESIKRDLECELRNGDEGALAKLFGIHRARLFGIVVMRMSPLVIRRVDPEDVLQEAFLAANKRIAHFASKTNTSAFLWLRMITIQTIFDLHRQHLGAQSRDVMAEISFVGGSDESSDSVVQLLLSRITSPTKAAVRAEMSERLRETLNELSSLDRQVLLLRHFEELTNQETANELEISKAAAANRYIRALGRLKECLSQFPDFWSI